MLSASGRVGARDNPAAAVMWYMMSAAMLAGLAAFAKYGTQQGVHPFQIVFLRNCFCLLMLMPMLWVRGPSIALTQSHRLYGIRVSISLVSMTIWFSTLAIIPLAELQAIGFLAPLFATAFAILLLGERVTPHRWMALAAGLAGALVILRPWGIGFGAGQAMALACALGIGLVGPLVKQLTAHDDPDKIVFITHLWLTPMSLLPALLVWSWPPLWLWPCLAAMGACAFFGHLALVRSYNCADASFVSTFEFARLPLAVAVGYVFFGETTDLWTWVGAAVIFLAAASVMRRESTGRRPATADGRGESRG